MAKEFRRIVVKIGTNALMVQGKISKGIIRDLARQLSLLSKRGMQVILVTSGAIGFGIEKLGVGFPKETVSRQAMAAIGQSALMHYYEEAFSEHGQIIGQVLLTHSSFTDPDSFSSLRGAMEKLLELRAIPIINENDVVSREALTAEKAFADNDGLAALLAVSFAADLLVILTDVDGIYTENPKENRNAKKVQDIRKVLEGEVMIGKKSDYGIGGMKSKIMAVKAVLDHHISVAVCQPKESAVLEAASGKSSGSFFSCDDK